MDDEDIFLIIMTAAWTVLFSGIALFIILM